MEGVRASLVTKMRVRAAEDEAIASDEDDNEVIRSSDDDNVTTQETQRGSAPLTKRNRESSTDIHSSAILLYRQTFTPNTKPEIIHLKEDQRKKNVSTTKALLKTATTQR
ncbi:hypothetical protein PROFUN_00672 [Planoprotostelium fungivorum]|uniref:Uncharacterized protein n=1 Tax=Planoprotostelium fungivorum TaxID=1890364 RepID=A0A2P6NU30_9EUKA|nr:hypothetical protein PROFUN_00672 [Planoprotostelium fungivorum]